MTTLNVLSKKIECDSYNASNCTSLTNCTTIEVCEETDPEKPSHCFAVWKTDNVTNQVAVVMKGCFTNNNACNQSECIDYNYEAKLQFCCCNDSFCNRNHKWIPTATEPPILEGKFCYL